MKHALVAIVLLLSVPGCGESGEEQAKEATARARARVAAEAPKEAPPPPPTKPVDPAKPADKPPEPEPTTPAEIDHARNQAMIDGRDKDVLKYCEMGKLDDKSNPQALLGCTLSACRIKDVDTAKRYSKPLQKAYLDQAKKVCASNGTAI